MEVMSPWKSKWSPSVTCPSRAQVGGGSGAAKHTEKIYCTSAFWKPEDNLLYFLRNSCCLCPAEPVPSQVTDCHTGSCLHRDFSLPLRFPYTTNKRKRCCFCTTLEDCGRASWESRKAFFASLVFSYWVYLGVPLYFGWVEYRGWHFQFPRAPTKGFSNDKESKQCYSSFQQQDSLLSVCNEQCCL